MRSMRAAPVAVFLLLLCLVFALAGGTLQLGARLLALVALRPAADGVVAWLAALLLIQLYAMLVHRLALAALPLRPGVIAVGSRHEAIYQVYVLFYLILFNTVLRGGWLPIPLLRLVYLALGAQMGANTYSCGIICDPTFVRIGANCIMGEGSLLVPHQIEGRQLAHFPIVIGDGVTVGAHVVLLPGVTIGNGAMVAANSVVTKGVHIGAGETWGGNPARLLARRAHSATPGQSPNKFPVVA